jgi:hypothetical protein
MSSTLLKADVYNPDRLMFASDCWTSIPPLSSQKKAKSFSRSTAGHPSSAGAEMEPGGDSKEEGLVPPQGRRARAPRAGTGATVAGVMGAGAALRAGEASARNAAPRRRTGEQWQ